LTGPGHPRPGAREEWAVASDESSMLGVATAPGFAVTCSKIAVFLSGATESLLAGAPVADERSKC
jgi:hypothetical protein